MLNKATIYALLLLITSIAYANPIDSGLSRMNSALEENGVANPNVSLGIKLHVPVNDPSDWTLKFDVPRSNMSSICDKPSSSAYSYVNPAKPCVINSNTSNK